MRDKNGKSLQFRAQMTKKNWAAERDSLRGRTGKFSSSDNRTTKLKFSTQKDWAFLGTKSRIRTWE